MTNIQPYDYQKRTNIEEHNDLVSKINEIIDVINQTNIETILPKINKLEADVIAINDTDNVQNTDIANLKEKDVQIDNRLTINENNIDGITKSLVSDVVLMNGTTTGNMKARIGRENSPYIDSNDYNIQKPVSVELVQGSASAMVKAKITLSDGTVLISDDFMFTTEAIGTDVYISSFVFKNGNVAGTISADIGLSNGSTLEANNFVVPTDPNVISSISDLQSRMTAVESGSGGLTDLKATVDGHTTAINELNTDVTSLKTDKADVNNGNQIITAGTINANIINKNGVAVATLNDIRAGEVWEEVDLSNFPTDWNSNDRVKMQFKSWTGSGFNQPSSWTASIGTITGISPYPSNENYIAEFGLVDAYPFITVSWSLSNEWLGFSFIRTFNASSFNQGQIGVVGFEAFNASGNSRATETVTTSNVTSFIYKMWRCRASA